MNKFLALVIVIICGIGLYIFLNYVSNFDKPEERNSVLPIFQDHEDHKDIPSFPFDGGE